MDDDINDDKLAKRGTESISLSPRPASGLMSIAQQREIAEVQAAMIVAQMNPRKYDDCKQAIIMACTRPDLAKKATYAYPKGKTTVSGPSIRLAEVMAQNWRNMDYGMRELEQNEESSTVESFCWDLETNVRQRRVFQVPHIIYSHEHGNRILTDPRDIYETTANMGSRRMRACILGVIPREIQDAALEQCRKTLEKSLKISPELIASIIAKFQDYEVTKAQLEAKIQRKMEAILPAQIFLLGDIYNSLKDGVSQPEDWFKKEKETATVSMATVMPGTEENRGHGKENLDQVPKEKEQDNPSGLAGTPKAINLQQAIESDINPFSKDEGSLF